MAKKEMDGITEVMLWLSGLEAQLERKWLRHGQKRDTGYTGQRMLKMEFPARREQ